MQGRLGDYPGLLNWYRVAATRAGTPADAFVVRTCETLADTRAEAVLDWVDALRGLIREASTPLAEFLAAEEICQRCDVELLDLMSEFGERAVRGGRGEMFLSTMRQAADATGLVALRFLSAWAALNCGQLELCVEECDRVTEPFASIYTLQGQALVELGRYEEGVGSLRVAVKLNPNELLAWFQLAKTSLAMERPDEAWSALAECQRLAPQSEEIALMLGLAVLDADMSVERARTAWKALKSHASAHGGVLQIFDVLASLALRLGEETRMLEVTALLDWPRLMLEREFVPKLAPLLRQLHEKGWMKASAALLTRLTPAA